MDMQMPVLDGFSATQQIKATTQGKSSVIIALTASSFEEDRKQALSAGCDDFLRKPYQLTEIYNMLSLHLGVAFVYKEPENLDRAASLKAGSPQISDLAPPDMTGVSDSLWLELRKATIAADIQQILYIIEKIDDQNPLAAAYLENLARNFEYRTMLALIDQDEEKKEVGS
jgi:DNA-binding response OmpR family regulator